MNKSSIFYVALLTCLLTLIFHPWFINSQIIGGDWPFFYQEGINDFAFPLPAWSFMQGNGLGGTPIIYALDSYLNFTGWFVSNVLHLPWNLVYKIFWFGLFLALSLFSSIFLIKTTFIKSTLWQQLLTSFLYTANTYILLVVSGGQLGFALGYAIAPLVLAGFINIINAEYKITAIKYSLIAGLLLSLQVLFDFRIAYIVMTAVIVYFLFTLKNRLSKNSFLFSIFISFIIPLGTTLLLHSFWILPFLLMKSNPSTNLGEAYTSFSSVTYYSFATFENAFGLLHPYWPENIFGKVNFMKPEFLLLPLLAFSSLFFLKKTDRKETNTVLFFVFLGLIGVFLAKGANVPFGEIYLWMFSNIPGFVIFRDPTKWYILIAISYSLLIPFVCLRIYEFLKHQSKKHPLFNLGNVFLIVVISYFLVLIYPALSNQLGGTFAKREVPSEYIILKDKLISDNTFYRTLWVPKQHRFSISTMNHPTVESGALFQHTDAANLHKKISSKETEKLLSELGVKYVIVPNDVYGEIFLNDRKYSQKKRDEYEKVLDNIVWLKKVSDGKLTIYETRTHKEHFYMQKDQKINYKNLNPTMYEINVKNVRKNDLLIFTDNYNVNWNAKIAENDGAELSSKPYALNSSVKLNSFVLPQDGSYTIHVYYSLDKYFTIGGFITLGSFIILVSFLIFIATKFKK